MSKDIDINESAILETLNHKIDYDGGNYPSSGLETYINKASYAKYLNKNQITNCLLEVPQNIKLELNNGALTLKKGSKVIVPNGVGVFDEVEVLKDLTLTQTYTGSLTVYVGKTASYISAFSGQNSSSNADIDTSGKVHYNTTTNKVTRISNAGTTEQLSFPIATITMNASTVTSIDQVFNGMGYIGSTVWVDKGVKVLIPDGRNADGTLKNYEYTTTKVLTRTDSGTATFCYGINPSSGGLGALHIQYYKIGEEKPSLNSGWWFDTLNNIFYNVSNGEFNKAYRAPVIITTITSGVISNFQPKLPFRAVDYNDITGLKAYITETYVNGTSWYRVWSDGWIEQGGRFDFKYATQTITFTKSFTTTNYCFVSATDSKDFVFEKNQVTCLSAWGSGYAYGLQSWYACGY